MSSWRKLVTKAGAMAVAGVMILSAPLTVKAWELDGNSSIDNDIETKNPSSLITTIQTDFHTGGATGFVVLTPSKTVDSILEITQEQWNAEGRGIIYINNSDCGPKAKEVLEGAAKKLNGEVLWYYDILLFKFDGSSNEQKLTTTSPLKMAMGIKKDHRSGNYEYAMVNLQDGVTTLYSDVDDDDYTLTFEADKFSIYAMIRYPKGTDVSKAEVANTEVANAVQQPAENNQVSNNELDDVPKTGDRSVIIGSTFIAVGLVVIMISTIKKRSIKL